MVWVMVLSGLGLWLLGLVLLTLPLVRCCCYVVVVAVVAVVVLLLMLI